MKKSILLVLLLTALLALPSCEKSEIPSYNPEYNSVRFPYRTSERNNEEPTGYDFERQVYLSSYTFFGNESATSHVVKVPLYIIGYEADHDREVKVEVLAENTTAPAGSYRVVEGIIAAGDSVGHLSIEVDNIPQLKEGNVQVAYQLVSSPEFVAGPPKHTKLLLSWGSRLLAPTASDYMRTYNLLIAGSPYPTHDTREYFSLNALELIVRALKWDDWDDKEKHEKEYNADGYKYLPKLRVIQPKAKAYRQMLSKYIEEHNQKHPNAPLLHDGGELQGQPIEVRER